MKNFSLAFNNLIRRPGRTLALALLSAFLSLAVFGGSVMVLSLRSGLHSLEARLGADIIVVPSQAQSKVSFQNMFLQGTTGAFYMNASALDQALEVEGVEKPHRRRSWLPSRRTAAPSKSRSSALTRSWTSRFSRGLPGV